jgi:hypothetical protein
MAPNQGLGVMNRIFSSIALIACLTHLPQAGAAESCPVSATKYLKQFDPTISIDGFYCGKNLANLQATLPKPLTVVAVGGLRWQHHNVIVIDLSRQKVSLDDYTNGDLPQGEIFIGGRIQRSGTLRYEPGITADAWFSPQPALISPEHNALAAELSTFKFMEGPDVAKFGFSQSLLNSECFTANVTIEIDGIHLVLGDTDEAGAYPIDFRVLKVSGVKKCSDQE